MGANHDRISELPDPILGHILSLMPIKPAMRTGILSTRWRDLWKQVWTSAITLDFTGELASRQTPEQLVACVDEYLQLHTRKKIGSFRLSLQSAKPYEEHLVRWAEFVTSKCVEGLDLDFIPPGVELYDIDAAEEENLLGVPGCLFSCGTLTHLTLSFCCFRPPVDFSSLRLLKSLSLRYVNIDDGMLREVLSNCLLLETLKLKECKDLVSVEITPSGASLKRLVLVNCGEGLEFNLQVSAPSMESFYFFGEINEDFSFDGATSLVDAFICSVGYECSEPEHDYTKVLSGLAHVRILTVCSATLMCVTNDDEYSLNQEYFPLRLENLQELQILMHTLDAGYLSFIYGFFRLCPFPFLEKLFIALPSLLEDPEVSSATQKIIEGPQSVQLDNLKTVKMSNFKGSHCEMELVKFLLGKAANLERLILVAPPAPLSDDKYRELVGYGISESRIVAKMDLKDLCMKLLSLPKASSRVQVVVSDYSKDDNSLKPTHTSVYCDGDLDWLT